MKVCRVKAYGKVNMFLDVVGERDGYHALDTVVATIDVYDGITVTARRDSKVVLRTGGGLYSVIDNDDNNAYKAAKLFVDTFGTNGVDVSLRKNIPVGSGLGGSSADIAGVLTAMKRLYKIDADVKPLADRLGSDSGYLLEGGFARLKGRGEIVEPLDLDVKLYMLVVPAKGGCNTKECFARYDALSRAEKECSAEELINALREGSSFNGFYNALYPAAIEVNPEIKKNYDLLASLSPSALFMSGSGSSVCAVYPTIELCLWALDKIKRTHRDAFVTETLTKKETEKSAFFKRSLYSIEEDD